MAENKRILQNPTEIFKNIPHKMSLILRLNRWRKILLMRSAFPLRTARDMEDIRNLGVWGEIDWEQSNSERRETWNFFGSY